MDHSAYQRARRPEQKEERKALLLATARQLLHENGDCNQLSLNGLARHAGMAKSNVYRYFEDWWSKKKGPDQFEKAMTRA